MAKQYSASSFGNFQYFIGVVEDRNDPNKMGRIKVRAYGIHPDNKEDVPTEAIDKAKEVFAAEVADKPAEMQEKIMDGKLSSYFKDQILLEQDFVKNPETTIAEMVSGAVQKFGENVSIEQISRVSLK